MAHKTAPMKPEKGMGSRSRTRRGFTPAPAAPDSRAKALAGMGKAELIKTIKALDARQTKLLNQVAHEKEKLEACQAVSATYMRQLQQHGFLPGDGADGVALSTIAHPHNDVPTPDDINPDSLESVVYYTGCEDFNEVAQRTVFPWASLPNPYDQEPK